MEAEAKEVLFSKRRALDALRQVFGHQDFRPGQIDAIKALANKKDVLVVMPTGRGKSVCYQVPALCSRGTAIVVSPLIALMKDQVDSLRQKGVRASFLNSSLSEKEANDVLDELSAGRLKMLYVTPERFKVRSFNHALATCHISFLAIDECHCISQWGHDFRIDYRRLGSVRDALGVPAIGLTATATVCVQDDIVSQLRMQRPLRIVTGFDRPNLSYFINEYESELEKNKKFFEVMGCVAEMGTPAIVYCATRKQADSLVRLIADVVSAAGASKKSVVKYHAGMKDSERKESQEAFLSGSASWIVATNAFGMGIDKPDIRYVLHCAMPGSVEAWYQEVGRAGRDGKPSFCEMFYSKQDIWLQRFFIDISNPSKHVLSSLWSFLLSYGKESLDMTYEEVHEAYCRKVGSKEVPQAQLDTAIRLLKKGKAIDPDSPRGRLVLDPKAKPIESYVDFELLSEKRAREVSRLEAMLGFTRSREPIRSRVLSYFGEKVGGLNAGDAGPA